MTWDVVATIRAPEPYLRRFIDCYRQLGASRIHIYYDDPDFAYPFPGDDLALTLCDEGYWAGTRPRAIEMRQTHNATRAAAQSTAEWLIHCDVDEHLHAPRPVTQILAEAPATCACLVALPYEAIYASRPASVPEIFATRWFKSTSGGWGAASEFWAGVYGDLHQFSAAGFWGHRVGKSFIRLSGLPAGHPMPIHMPSGEAFRSMGTAKSKELRLLHFDALLPEDWLQKHGDRATKKVRTKWLGEKRKLFAQHVHDTFTAGGEPAALELYDRLFVVPGPMLEEGLAKGVVARVGQ